MTRLVDSANPGLDISQSAARTLAAEQPIGGWTARFNRTGQLLSISMKASTVWVQVCEVALPSRPVPNSHATG